MFYLNIPEDSCVHISADCKEALQLLIVVI